MDNDKLSRRTFVRQTSLMTVGAVAGAVVGNETAAKNGKPIDPSTIRNYNPKMGYRRLGKTDLLISEVSMGGHNYMLEGRHKYYHRTLVVPEDVDDLQQFADYYKERTAQIACALDAGINFFDISMDKEVRSLSVALERLGRRDECYLNSDFARGYYRKEKTPEELRESMIEHINKSIRVLKTEHVDTVRIVTFEQWSKEDLAAGIDAFQSLKKEGKAKFFGISSHDPQYLIDAVRTFDEIEIIWTPYSFGCRRAEKELFPLCQNKGVGVITIKPYHGGAFFLAQEKARKDTRVYVSTPSPETLKRIDVREGESLAQANRRYVLSNTQITATVPGMNSRQEIMENTAVSMGGERELADPEKLERHTEAIRRVLPPEYAWLQKWYG